MAGCSVGCNCGGINRSKWVLVHDNVRVILISQMRNGRTCSRNIIEYFDTLTALNNRVSALGLTPLGDWYA